MLKEILQDTIKLNEIKLNELPKIDYKWNPNKEENNKMLIQLNKRLKYPHFNEKYITNALNKGIKEGLEKGLKLKNTKNDLCILYTKSNFILVYNRRNDYIRGIRIDDNVTCKSNVGVNETYEEKQKLLNDMEVYSFYDGEIINGIKFKIKGFSIIAESVCECVKVKL